MPYDKRDLASFQDVLGYQFLELKYLERALIHSSGASEAGGRENNERLEFLGDAVLELVITDLLFQAFREAPEGYLTQVRAHLVKAPSLAKQAREIQLGTYLYLGRGEEISGGAEKESILSAALEAVLGAVYLDGGISSAFEVVSRLMKSLLDEVLDGRNVRDAKSLLQEFALRHVGCLPQYILIDAQGLDHAKTFRVRVKVGDTTEIIGTGMSKKAAEQDAAKRLLEIVQQERC